MFVSVVASAILAAGCSTPEEKAAGYYEKGMVLLEQGELVKARLEFQNALQISANMNEAMYGLALVFERQGDLERMYALLNKVVEQDPKHLEAQLKLGRLLLAGKQLDRALKASDLTIQLSPDDSAVMAFRAAVLYRLGDNARAVEQANAALAKDPKNIDALVVLATERLKADDPRKALAHLDLALESNEKNVALQLIKVQALEKLADHDGTERVLRKLTELHPDKRELRHVLAQFYLSHGKQDSAESVYRAIVAENPDDVQAKLDVVRLMGELRGSAASIGELTAFIKSNPDQEELKFALAELHQSQRDLLAAEEVLRQIMKADPDGADGLNAKGRLAALVLARGERDSAATLVKEVLAKDQRDEQALFLRATIAIDDRQLEAAISDLRTILKDVPGSARALLMLGRAHDLAGAPELADDQYARAFQASKLAPTYGLAYAEFLRKRRNLGQAEKVLNDVLRATPGDLPTLRMLAQVRINQGNLAGAQEVADEIHRLGNQDQLSDRIIGSVRAAQKDYDASIAAFRRAYDAAPTESQPVMGLVRAYIAAGKADDAMGFLNSVLRASPDNVSVQLIKGQLQLLMGDDLAAEATFREIIRANPATQPAYQNLISLYLRGQRFGEAEKVVAEGLAAIPGDFGLRLSKAALFENSGRPDEAMPIYEELLAERPNADVLANNLASLLSDHRSDQASLARAYELAQRFARSDVPQFKDTLGWASYKIGKHREARSLLVDASTQMPEMAVFHYHLGMTHVALQEKEAARRALEKALELAKDAPFAEAERAKLALEKL